MNTQSMRKLFYEYVQPPSPEVFVELSDNDSETNEPEQEHIITGRWTHQLLGGCCESLVPNGFMAVCCTGVAVAQVTFRTGMMSYPSAIAVFGSLAFLSTVVPWVLLASHLVLTEAELDGRDDWQELSQVAVIACLVFLIGHTAFGVLTSNLRFRIRTRFQIPGTWSHDFVVSCCCQCCVAGQMASHVKSFKPGRCSFGAPEQLAAYKC